MSLLGDCQNLALTLIELCGWKEDYEALLQAYKAEHGVARIVWEDTYNFDRIEDHLWEYEKELQAGTPMQADSDSSEEEKEEAVTEEKEEEEDSFLSFLRSSPYLQHCVARDDGRTLPQYGENAEDVEVATQYFFREILKGRVNNSFVKDVGTGERVVLRLRGVLLTLNSANSRCFKELLKWGTKEYTDYSEWPVCNKHNTRNRLEESASSSSSTPHSAFVDAHKDLVLRGGEGLVDQLLVLLVLQAGVLVPDQRRQVICLHLQQAHRPHLQIVRLRHQVQVVQREAVQEVHARVEEIAVQFEGGVPTPESTDEQRLANQRARQLEVLVPGQQVAIRQDAHVVCDAVDGVRLRISECSYTHLILVRDVLLILAKDDEVRALLAAVHVGDAI